MTILKPHFKSVLRSFLLTLAAVLLLGGLVYIYEYNALVNVRYDLRGLKQSLIELQVANADLKDGLYRATLPARLEAIAREKELLLEKHPEYLTYNQWVSDSSR